MALLCWRYRASQLPPGGAAHSSNNRITSARAVAVELRGGQRRNCTTMSRPGRRRRMERNASRTSRFIRLRSTARGATRLLVMMPMRARSSPLGLTYSVK